MKKEDKEDKKDSKHLFWVNSVIKDNPEIFLKALSEEVLEPSWGDYFNISLIMLKNSPASMNATFFSKWASIIKEKKGADSLQDEELCSFLTKIMKENKGMVRKIKEEQVIIPFSSAFLKTEKKWNSLFEKTFSEISEERVLDLIGNSGKIFLLYSRENWIKEKNETSILVKKENPLFFLGVKNLNLKFYQDKTDNNFNKDFWLEWLENFFTTKDKSFSLKFSCVKEPFFADLISEAKKSWSEEKFFSLIKSSLNYLLYDVKKNTWRPFGKKVGLSSSRKEDSNFYFLRWLLDPTQTSYCDVEIESPSEFLNLYDFNKTSGFTILDLLKDSMNNGEKYVPYSQQSVVDEIVLNSVFKKFKEKSDFTDEEKKKVLLLIDEVFRNKETVKIDSKTWNIKRQKIDLILNTIFETKKVSNVNNNIFNNYEEFFKGLENEKIFSSIYLKNNDFLNKMLHLLLNKKDFFKTLFPFVKNKKKGLPNVFINRDFSKKNEHSYYDKLLDLIKEVDSTNGVPDCFINFLSDILKNYFSYVTQNMVDFDALSKTEKNGFLNELEERGSIDLNDHPNIEKIIQCQQQFNKMLKNKSKGNLSIKEFRLTFLDGMNWIFNNGFTEEKLFELLLKYKSDVINKQNFNSKVFFDKELKELFPTKNEKEIEIFCSNFEKYLLMKKSEEAKPIKEKEKFNNRF